MRLQLRRLGYIAVSLAAVLAGGPLIANAQNADAKEYRTVHIETHHLHDAVTVVGLRYRGLLFREGTPILAGSDWLKKASVIIRNDTQKRITAGVVHLDFPDTETQGPPRVGHQMRLGQEPEHALFTRRGKELTRSPREPFLLLPGHKAEISLAPEFDRIKEFIEKRLPISTVKTCWVRLLIFYFDDGTRWAVSHYERPDPEHPGIYVPITVAELKAQGSSH